MSSSRSTSSMGARCGSSFLICSTSRAAGSLMFVLGSLAGQTREGIYLARPFSYRLRRRAAIILSALQEDGRARARAGAHAGAGADAAVIAEPYLSRQDHAVFQHHAAGKSGLARDHAVAPDAAIVRDHDQVIELGALADHRVGQRAAIDGGAGADLDIVLDDHPAELRQLEIVRSGGSKAETRLADGGTRQNDHTIADIGVADADTGADLAMLADGDAGPDHRARAQPGAVAD